MRIFRVYHLMFFFQGHPYIIPVLPDTDNFRKQTLQNLKEYNDFTAVAMSLPSTK